MSPAKKSSMLERIEAAVDTHPASASLRVSVAPDAKWEDSPLGDQVLVRWACWNLLDSEGNELTPPEFEALSKDVTKERLTSELPRSFPSLQILVDEDIE